MIQKNPSTPDAISERHEQYTADVAEATRVAQENPDSYEKQVRVDIARFKAGVLAVRAVEANVEVPVDETSIAIFNDARERYGS